MKKISILFLFFINFLNAFGKEIIKYEGKKLNVSKKISILEDENKIIKEEDIVKGFYYNKFESNKDQLLYLRKPNTIYYIKVEVQNLSLKNRLELHGWFGPVTLNRTNISLLDFNNGKLTEFKFTRKINENDEKNLLNFGYKTFEISPRQIKTIYIKISSPVTTPLILTTLEDIIKEENIHSTVTNISNTLSLIIILVILGFYIKVKKNYLLYYSLVFIFTYLKSDLFLRFIRNYVSFDVYIIYAISVILYLFFLIKFVIDILKLNKRYTEIKNYLTFLKYAVIGLGLLYLFGGINLSNFIEIRGYLYLVIFTLILYVAMKRYSDGWLYKAFFFSWLPQWILYSYFFLAYTFKLKILFFDIRTIEYLEIFTNLISTSVLLYDAKELWRGRNTVEDQEEFVKIINGADNLMHGLLTLIHSYKKDINFDRVMFFRRKVDRESDDVLYYDFSVPLSLNEREEEKKYFDLAKILHKDKYDEYYICEDIQSNELYKILLPQYKSFIAIRLKFVEGGDLGYIVILNKNKIEYEYDEVMKDFKYKSSLLVQHFKTIDDIREKYGSIIVEETLRNFHMEVLRDAEKDITNTLEQLDKIKTISNKYIVDNDPNVKRVLNLFYDDLEKLMISITKDLKFDNPDKKTKNKIMFTYSIIEEMLNYLKDVTRKTSNKVNINIINQVDSDYELYGHIKIIRSIINHFLTYMYDRVIKHNIDSTITIITSLEEGKLKLDAKIEGVNIKEEILRKEYNSEVHKVLLNSTRSKLELKSNENNIEVIYLLNVLTKEEKKRFNIKHLEYDDVDDLDNESWPEESSEDI